MDCAICEDAKFLAPEAHDPWGPCPCVTNVTPLVKWVGSKRWLTGIIGAPIMEAVGGVESKGRYIEPFLGSGAIALYLGLPNMLLSDACAPLIEMYENVRDRPDAVAWALVRLVEKGTDKESYLRVRAEKPKSVVFAAARFLYLNKFGFNGLYRVNRKGEFNVPYGDAKRGERAQQGGVIPSLEEIRAVSSALQSASLTCGDFREVLRGVRTGDVVYADPPYYGTFSNYTAEGFTEADHVALSEMLRGAADRGAAVIVSNSDEEKVRELYAWGTVLEVDERRAVGATVDRRKSAPALLVTANIELIDRK